MKILEPSVPFIDLTFQVLDSESQNEAGFFLFCQGNLLLRQEKPYALKHQDLPAGIDLNAALYVGTLENRPYYAIALSDSKLGMDAVGLRSLMDSDQPFFQLMARAYHLIHWDSTHRFCGRCGTRTCLSRTELVRQCPACDFRVYPRLSPCVIMLVHRGDDILLAQRPGGSTLYAVQAGFIEAGESAEEAVAREVMEETGLTLSSLSYFGSQPWPFPDQLMLGYFAENKSGELVPDPIELQNAGWFNCFDLPEYPGPQTISGKLIDHFVAMRTELAASSTN